MSYSWKSAQDSALGDFILLLFAQAIYEYTELAAAEWGGRKVGASTAMKKAFQKMISKWLLMYRLAAEQGHADAQVNLGFCSPWVLECLKTMCGLMPGSTLQHLQVWSVQRSLKKLLWIE